MFWALEKRLTETVPLSTHSTCIRHHRDIVIEPNICFWRSKNVSPRLLFLVPTTHISDTLFFLEVWQKHMDLFLGRFSVSHNHFFYFRETLYFC